MNRVAYHSDESFYACGQYVLARIDDMEAGYTNVGQYDTLAEARAVADRLNGELHLTHGDVLDIRTSSMAAHYAEYR